MKNNVKIKDDTQSPQSCVSVSVTDELLQKIKFVLSCGNESQASRIIEQYVHYQEEMTIAFADWLNNGRFSQYGDSWTNPRLPKDKDGDWVFFSSKQLYDIFKRERNLTEH
jgi:hypothetical protein